MDHQGLKLRPVNGLCLSELNLLRGIEDFVKEKPGSFRLMIDRIMNGELRVWRFSGPCDLLVVLGKEDNWLNIHFASGSGIWGNREGIAKHLLALAESNHLEGLRCYTDSPNRVRLFKAFGAVSRPFKDRTIIELTPEDFRYGRRRRR